MITFLLVASALSACATATSNPDISWGKPGVSYVQYREDSIECAIDGSRYNLVASGPYKDIDRGLKSQYRVLEQAQGDQSDQIRDYSMTYQRNIRGRIDDIQTAMVNRVHMCLRARDYKEFYLTEAQSKRLAQFDKGTEPRFRYLHSLASDAANIPPDLPSDRQ